MSETYQIDPDPIATGGQGAVHFATDATGALLAVKVSATGSGSRHALLREIELVKHMNDAGVRGVIPCLDQIEVHGRPAMVMPRYDDHMGTWLKSTILEPGENSMKEVLSYHKQLSRILSSVHKVYYEGGTVVHRDVKPENIFVKDGSIFLGDFGGAMAVEELRAVELAMFGTPMWAPLDQLLPGKAMPDTTWDTYATCVLLYAAVTGARPAYQADPRELLTTAGRALWQAAREAVDGDSPDRTKAQKRFAGMRKGTSAGDLVDLTGRAALVSGDREAIAKGVHKLGVLANLPERTQKSLERGLWNILVRGLSPVSHPSPPNRYRDADELADAIEELEERLTAPATVTPAPARRQELGSLLGDPSLVFDDDERATTNLSSGPPVAPIVLGVVLLALAGIGTWYAWPTLRKAYLGTMPLPLQIEVPAGTVQLEAGAAAVPAFRMDTTEVSVADFQACVASTACAGSDQRNGPEHPVMGLGIADAEALCAFREGRVPTESQWRRAHGEARFPWGEDKPTCDKAVALGCGDEVGPVGSARQGVSPHGAVDMAGNVWEWARAIDGTPVLLGGAMTSTPKELGAAGRKAVAPDTRPSLAGVRCVYPG